VQLEIRDLDRKYAPLRIDDPVRRAHLAASIAREGQQGAVLVVRVSDRLVLVDGYQRVRALEDLGRDVVDAVVLEGVEEMDALILRHRMQARRSTALEDGWLLAELVDGHGRDQRDLATALQRSASWVSRRLALVRALPANAQDAVRDGIVPPHAAMKFLVPLARATRRDCEALVAALGSTRVSTRDLERIYVAWRRADADGRRRIVADPHLFLKVDAELGTEPDLPVDEAAALIDDLEGIAGLCRRARKRIRGGVLDRATDGERAALAPAWRETRESVVSLITRMEGSDDRPRDADGGAAPVARGPQRAADRAIAEAVTEHGQGHPDERVGGGADDRA
jgi:ParB/RepB/Spo0J family partition protein